MHMLDNDCREPSAVRIAIARGTLLPALIAVLKAIGCALLPEPDRNGFLGRGFAGNWTNVSFFVRDRRMIPCLVAYGRFSAGITGRDIVFNSGLPLKYLSTLASPESYWALASVEGWMPQPGSEVGCELEEYFAPLVLKRAEDLPPCKIVHIEGHEECAIEDGLCQAILVATRTGDSIRKKGLVIRPGCEKLFTSSPMLVSRNQRSVCEGEALSVLVEALRRAGCGD